MIPRPVRTALLAASALGVTFASSAGAAPAESTSASAAFPPSLVGEWWSDWGDCANSCLKITWGYLFQADGSYLRAEEHRTTGNEGGLPIGCIDVTLATEDGTFTGDGSSLATHPAHARAKHTNNCHPEQDFDRPAPLVPAQFRWAERAYKGQVQLQLTDQAGQARVYTRQGGGPPPPPPPPPPAPRASHVVLDVVGYLPGASNPPLALLAQPQRLVDTRTTQPIATGTSSCFRVAGQQGIPADAAGVVLNVTAAGYGTPGWLTLFPAGQSVPATSTLNFDPSAYAIANGSIARIGAGGQVCVSVGTANAAAGGSHVVLDATGYVPGGASAQLALLQQPQRVVDTRTLDGPLATGTSRCFSVAGQPGIPADARGLVLNVAAAGYTTRGWLSLYPAGQAVPATSTLNFDPSAYAIANGTIARVGTNGQVCVNVGTIGSAPGSAHVVLDVVGYLPAASNPQLALLAQPQRLVDTRTGDSPIATGTSRCFSVAGLQGIPADARGVVLNVAGAGYTAPGWLSLYPAGQPVPATSTLNFDPSAYAIANGTIARIGAGGQVCVNVGTIG